MVCGALCTQGCLRAAEVWQPGFGSGALSRFIRISLIAWLEANTVHSAESTLQLRQGCQVPLTILPEGS